MNTNKQITIEPYNVVVTVPDKPYDYYGIQLTKQQAEYTKRAIDDYLHIAAGLMPFDEYIYLHDIYLSVKAQLDYIVGGDNHQWDKVNTE